MPPRVEREQFPSPRAEVQAAASGNSHDVGDGQDGSAGRVVAVAGSCTAERQLWAASSRAGIDAGARSADTDRHSVVVATDSGQHF